ncbi:MAG: hypothetical protein O7E52_20975 [Candidatus Poribacteria bacterium]|nr:hypothetical protein [Candidatus Poribacteria bacterium]
MAKRYKACLIGCGRMGATIDDEVRDHPHSFLWPPYSHAAGHIVSEHTDLVKGVKCNGDWVHVRVLPIGVRRS